MATNFDDGYSFCWKATLNGQQYGNTLWIDHEPAEWEVTEAHKILRQNFLDSMLKLTGFQITYKQPNANDTPSDAG